MADFGTFLVEKGVFTAEQLEAVSGRDSSGEPIYYRLLRRYPELERPLWESLAEFLEVELVDPLKVSPGVELARLVPAQLAHEYSIVPLSCRGEKLEIALADPRQFEKCEEFSLLLARAREGTGPDGELLSIVGRLARPSDIAGMIKSLYGIGAETLGDMLDEQMGVEVTVIGPEVVDLTQQESGGEDAAIVRFVNQLLLEAVQIGASDIHLEPFEKELRVRYRVDGMLQREPVPEKIKHLEAAIISRIKIMAHMDIAEKRLPQDGQIRLMVLGRGIDVRVSVLPTLFGQGLALRLLDRQVAFRQLEILGMSGEYLRLQRKVLGLSHGVILVTGPTGSGKTTTLYACLHEINREERKVITVEDPIEYQLEGITQIRVRPQIGLSFSNVLRSILRHDPDIIMVGEIRDSSTARIAISAAMTGHLVFSTLHTNDAPSAPVRLLDMGVEPYLVSSALEAVLAQRLIRLLCSHCRGRAVLAEGLGRADREVLEGRQVYESKGCPVCRWSGYLGRTAIFEMFTLNDRIRHLILNRGNADQIRQEAQALGMVSLHQSGLAKVKEGVSSLAEVYRVARDETIDMKGELKVES